MSKYKSRPGGDRIPIARPAPSNSGTEFEQSKAACNEELAGFDQLPDLAHIRLPTLCKLYGCASATIWRAVKANRIPAPHRLATRVTAWQVGEIRQSLAQTR